MVVLVVEVVTMMVVVMGEGMVAATVQAQVEVLVVLEAAVLEMEATEAELVGDQAVQVDRADQADQADQVVPEEVQVHHWFLRTMHSCVA